MYNHDKKLGIGAFFIFSNIRSYYVTTNPTIEFLVAAEMLGRIFSEFIKE